MSTDMSALRDKLYGVADDYRSSIRDLDANVAHQRDTVIAVFNDRDESLAWVPTPEQPTMFGYVLSHSFVNAPDQLHRFDHAFTAVVVTRLSYDSVAVVPLEKWYYLPLDGTPCRSQAQLMSVLDLRDMFVPYPADDFHDVPCAAPETLLGKNFKDLMLAYMKAVSRSDMKKHRMLVDALNCMKSVARDEGFMEVTPAYFAGLVTPEENIAGKPTIVLSYTNTNYLLDVMCGPRDNKNHVGGDILPNWAQIEYSMWMKL